MINFFPEGFEKGYKGDNGYKIMEKWGRQRIHKFLKLSYLSLPITSSQKQHTCLHFHNHNLSRGGKETTKNEAIC